MKTKKVVRKIFDTLNYSKKLKISSILPDQDSDYVILLELEDGSKFELDSDGLHVKVLEIKDHRMLHSLVCVENFKNSESSKE